MELPSICRVELKGTRDRVISIEPSEEELRRHNLRAAVDEAQVVHPVCVVARTEDGW